MKTMMKAVLITAALVTLGTQASLAQAQSKTTGVTMSNGDRVLVHTDRRGTIVVDNASRRHLYTAGGDRHNEAVKAYGANGGKVHKTITK